MNNTLQNKVALVTGASRGIGAAIAQRLASYGARIAITYANSPARAHEVVSAIQSAGGTAIALRADSANTTELQQAVRDTVQQFGSIDILVNNAGIAAVGPIADFSLEDLDRTIDINIKAVFIASQEAARHMSDGGRIINIGSTNAERINFPGATAYAMSKAALVGFTKGLSRELGPRAITVNNVEPGPTDTDMNPATGPFAEMLKSHLALNRYGKAEEIAGLVAYLAGPEAAYITGASLLIDGGYAA